MRILRVAVFALAFVAASTEAQAPIFRFSTDESWLNLHHFLYVLGRARNHETDATRSAVAGAVADESAGLAHLSEGDRKTWSDAVDWYARGLSHLDLIFDDTLASKTLALAGAGDRANLAGVAVSAPMRATLEAAMPIYRKAWWPEHREWNRSWVADVEAQLPKLGKPMLDTLTRDFGLPWPAAGYPVHIAGWANWAGAYSTTGNLLVVESNEANPRGARGLEAVFHEASHQWDDSMSARIVAASKAAGRRFDQNLGHAIIFYTTGDAMKRLVPGYQTYADIAGIWNRALGRELPALQREWQPWLDHRVGFDEALSRVVRALPTPVVDTLITMERESWSAWKARDSSFFSRFLSDDHVEVGFSGVIGKQAVLRGVASSACRVESFAVDQFIGTAFNGSTVVLTYHAAQNTTCGGAKVPSPVWVSSTFIRRNGRWQNVLYQQSQTNK